MRKIISKILIILILAILLTEFSFSSISYASIGLDSNSINLITNLAGGLVSLLFWIGKLFLTGTLYGLSVITTGNIAEIDGGDFGDSKLLSPFEIFFNKYQILNVNLFDVNAEGTITPEIRKAVARWFYIVRNISASILLVILIYVGIRMAISTVASEKARYQKMLWDWACSLILIFVLQYLGIFIIKINEAIVEMLNGLIGNDDSLGEAVNDILGQSLYGIGISGIMAFLVYLMITIQTLFFFVGYLNRVIKVAFLIIISPLISVTYSIDKMGDGKAQALNNWLKEFVYTILIQPFDCIMYVAFVGAAASLLVVKDGGILERLGLTGNMNQIANGTLAILCLKFINDGEKIIRKIFNFQDDNSSTSMAAGTALAVMTVQRMNKIGQKGTKMFGKDSTIGKAFQKDLNKFKGTDAGKFISKGFEKAKDSINDTKGMQFFKKSISGYKKTRNKYHTSKLGRLVSNYRKKSTSYALGAMTAAMMYAGGESSAMEAFATGRKVKNMADNRFSASVYGAAKDTENSHKILYAAAKRVNEEKLDEAEEFLDTVGIDEEDRDKVDKYDKEAQDAEIEERNEREAARERIRSKRISEIEDEMKNIKPIGFEANPDGKNVPIMPEEYKKLQAEKERLENGTLTDEELKAEEEAINDDEFVKAKHENAANKAKISQMIHQRQEALHFKNDEDYALDRVIREGSRTVSDKEFESQAAAILKLIKKIKAQNKMNEGEQTDSESINVLDDKDIDSAERMTQRLADTIQHTVLAGGTFDTRDYIARHLGIRTFDDPKTLGYQLAVEVEKYNRLANQQNAAKSGFAAMDAIGVKRDRYVEEVKMLLQSEKPEKRSSTKRSTH